MCSEIRPAIYDQKNGNGTGRFNNVLKHAARRDRWVLRSRSMIQVEIEKDIVVGIGLVVKLE